MRAGHLSDESTRLRRLPGSIMAILGGWISVMGTALACAWIRSLLDEKIQIMDWIGLTAISSLFVWAGWLFVVAPLYFLVSSRSKIWRWYVASPLGALAGFALLVVFILFGTRSPFYALREDALLLLLAAMIGASTGLIGALLRRRPLHRR